MWDGPCFPPDIDRSTLSYSAGHRRRSLVLNSVSSNFIILMVLSDGLLLNHMIRTDQRLLQAQARARMAVAVIAQQLAIKATKQQLRSKGLKPQHMSHREIVAAAEAYLAKHPELIA